MDKQTFFNLIDKYRDGTATDAEKALVEAYYQRLEKAGSTSLSSEEETALKESMYEQIKAGMHDQDTTAPRVTARLYRLVAAAAAVLILKLFCRVVGPRLVESFCCPIDFSKSCKVSLFRLAAHAHG